MQATCSRTITSWAFLLIPVTDVEVANTETSFLALEASGTWINSGPFDCNSNRLLGPGLVDFFSFRAFLEISALSKPWRAGTFCFLDLDLWLLEFFCSFAGSSLLEGRWPQKQQLSISFLREQGWKAVLASILIAFWMASFQIFRFQPHLSD